MLTTVNWNSFIPITGMCGIKSASNSKFSATLVYWFT